MGYGIAIFLLTLGAIFKWAITADIKGIDLQNLGVIFMVMGGLVLVLLIYQATRQSQEEPPRMRNERLSDRFNHRDD